MPKRFSLLVALSLILSLMSLFAAPAQAAERDRSDFDIQALTQPFHFDSGGSQHDPHQLDTNDDACDSLPGPCLGVDGRAASAGEGDGTGLGKRARVVEVSDGDSIKVRLIKSGARRNVRLIGIDTPEVHGRIECGGPEASRSLKRMLPPGQVVRLVSDPKQDNRDLFNRLLRYVVKPGDKDVARKQLRRGWARIFIFGGDSFERVTSYRRARDAAQAADRGAWNKC